MTTYLGIDYGQKHLGVALADGPLATPLVSLDLDLGLSLTRLAKLASDHAADAIVIGLPEGKLQPEIRAFGDKLRVVTGLPVYYQEESLTTEEALSKLRAGGAKKRKLRDDHVYAACLILEDYLENKVSISH